MLPVLLVLVFVYLAGYVVGQSFGAPPASSLNLASGPGNTTAPVSMGNPFFNPGTDGGSIPGSTAGGSSVDNTTSTAGQNTTGPVGMGNPFFNRDTSAAGSGGPSPGAGGTPMGNMTSAQGPVGVDPMPAGMNPSTGQGGVPASSTPTDSSTATNIDSVTPNQNNPKLQDDGSGRGNIPVGDPRPPRREGVITNINSLPHCGAGNFLVHSLDNCTVEGFLSTNETQLFTFTIPPMKPGGEESFSLLVSLRVIEGLGSLSLALPGSTYPTYRGVSLYRSMVDDEQYLFVPSTVMEQSPGTYTLMMYTESSTALFELRIQTPSANTTLVEPETAALREVEDLCCTAGLSPLGKRYGWCEAILPSATSPKRNWRQDLCHQPPNVCNKDGHLTKLVLAGGGLFCEKFPTSLGQLTHLHTLDLAYNILDEELEIIVQALSNLTSLERLYLRYTRIKGEITCALPRVFPNLKVLTLSGNSISGPIPPCLLDWPSLQQLYISATNLTGPLPEIPPNSNLRILLSIGRERGPGLTGRLPASLSTARNLQYLDLSANKLVGPLPELPWSLVLLNISHNDINGTIPPVPPTLETLDMAHNLLTGNIPGSLTAAENMSIIDLSYNRLSGTVPDLPKGQLIFVDLHQNSLAGPLPSLPISLRYLDICNNTLSGPLPDINSPNLETALLHNNSFAGPLPYGWYSSRSLKLLNLNSNNIQDDLGQLEWGQSVALTSLDLGNNKFGGAIPASLASLPNLQYLSLANNQLSGDLNPFANALPDPANQQVPASAIIYFNVSGNRLIGGVPEKLGQLGVLRPDFNIISEDTGDGEPRVFDISRNQLQGPFPSWLLTRVQSIMRFCRCEMVLKMSGGNVLTCPGARNLEGLTHGDLAVLQEYNLTCVEPGQKKEVDLVEFIRSGGPNAVSPAPMPPPSPPPSPTFNPQIPNRTVVPAAGPNASPTPNTGGMVTQGGPADSRQLGVTQNEQPPAEGGDRDGVPWRIIGIVGIAAMFALALAGVLVGAMFAVKAYRRRQMEKNVYQRSMHGGDIIMGPVPTGGRVDIESQRAL